MRLGKHLTLGFLLSLLALGLYYALAQHVIGDNELTKFDGRVADRLHMEALESPTARQFFRIVTELGDVVSLAVMSLAVALVLVWWHHRMLALVWLIAQAGGGLLNQILKHIVNRDRPEFAREFTTAPGYSFPSGHSMASLVAYGMLAYLLVLAIQVRWLRCLVVALLALLVLAIGFSRMFLGAHWFSDVIGGYCAATVWLTCCIMAIETVRRRRLRMREAGTPPLEARHETGA